MYIMIKIIHFIIFTMVLLISCSISYIGKEYVVNEIINKPEKYYEVLIDTNYVFENVKGSDRFKDMLYYIKSNKLELVDSDNNIYDGIKYVTLFYNDNNSEIMIKFIFYQSIYTDRWKLQHMYFENIKITE